MSQVYSIQGRDVEMPVVVRDARSGNAMYMVPSPAVTALLPGNAFEVVEAAPGKTQLILGMIDYRDNDLGDYDEVAVIFFVKPRGAAADAAGTFIYSLPVNESFTCEAGCTIWGFPKSVQTIDLSYADDRATCRLEIDGRHAFTLSVPRQAPVDPTPEENPGIAYTYIDGMPHRTAMTNGGTGTVLSAGGAGVTLELGDHALADDLRTLGLPDAPPLLSTWTEHMLGTFGAPEKL